MGYYYLAETFYNKRRKLDLKEKKFITVYRNMMSRCYNEKNISFSNYGKRGIKVCWKWHNFDNFYKDMWNNFDINKSLERKNNNGNYEYKNCKWADKTEQSYNRRSNRILTFKEISLPIGIWAEKLKIKRSTLEMRLDNYKWDIEKALTFPVRERRVKS